MRNSIDPVRKLREVIGSSPRAKIAREIGVSPQYLHDVLNGRRGVGDRILAYLGYERVVSYRRKRMGK
jgi:hypothetical protein